MRRRTRRLVLTSCLAAVFAASPALAEMDNYPVARLRMLDKVTARTSTFDVKVDTTVRFGRLYIKPRACRKAPPIEQPESASFLQIWETAEQDKPQWIFSGWMFASSPALSSMDHPIYDVWVLDCVGTPAGGSAADAGGIGYSSSGQVTFSSTGSARVEFLSSGTLAPGTAAGEYGTQDGQAGDGGAADADTGGEDSAPSYGGQHLTSPGGEDGAVPGSPDAGGAEGQYPVYDPASNAFTPSPPTIQEPMPAPSPAPSTDNPVY